MVKFDEKEIVDGCLRGSRKAQQALYDRFASKMLGLCFRYCDSIEEAEDVLQEAFIRVFQHIGTVRNEGALEAWVRRIMINTSLNYLAKIAEYRYHDDLDEIPEGSQPEAVTGGEMEVEELLSLIKSLPVGYRTVFNLFEIEGYGHPEIAAMLGISVNTSKSQLLKARRMLQRKLDTVEKR